MPDIIKKFFDTFEIEKKTNQAYGVQLDYHIEDYPQITDRILLELICILSPYVYSSGKNIQHLKESVLEWCIKYKQDIKQQIQELFEGE